MTALTPLEILQKQLTMAQARKDILDSQYALSADRAQRDVDNLNNKISALEE